MEFIEPETRLLSAVPNAAEGSDRLSKVDKTISVDTTEASDPLRGVNLGPNVGGPYLNDGLELGYFSYEPDPVGHIFRQGEEASELDDEPESEDHVLEKLEDPSQPKILVPAGTSLGTVSDNKALGSGEMSSEQIQLTVAEFISKHSVNGSGDLDEQLQSQIAASLQSELSKSIAFSGLANFLVSSISRLTKENAMLLAALREAKDEAKTEVSSKEAGKVTEAQEEDHKHDATNLVAQSYPAGQQTSGPAELLLVHEEFHSVICKGVDERRYFRDAPRKFKGDLRTDHLRGLEEVEDISVYLEKNAATAFAIIHTHYCVCMRPKVFRGVGFMNGRLMADTPPDTAKDDDTIIFVGNHATHAISSILKQHPDQFPGFVPNILQTGAVAASTLAVFNTSPLLFYLHGKTLMKLVELDGLDRCEARALCLVTEWFEVNRREGWNEADELLSRGRINRKHSGKLFHPGELIVQSLSDSEEGNLIRIFTLSKAMVNSSMAGVGFLGYWTRCSWEFNGRFWENVSLFDPVKLIWDDPDHADDETERDITALAWYPLRFASPGLKERIIARGQKLWSYREKRIVCYIEQRQSRSSSGQAERRMMIDYTVYRRLYPAKDIFVDHSDKRLSEEAMDQPEPPEGDFVILLPAQVHAFDFATKEWSLVRVDQLTNVTWDKDAFKQLVAPPKTKELIQAAISAHGTQLKAAPDIIAGKGQGLLILLHGGPGTGKTLTAESIAEEQERPLYRVTCGDMGTTPSDIESYLAAVLELGKCWGCVVLLDEADVFLEERTHADQNRNAIISVFLRVLEYYDGILILTTNRVGSFDEAFKSRIHLALLYPNLGEEQRERIWMNFIKMLDQMNERVDIADLELNIHRMARIRINGRQIRNVITIARHLAKFRRQRLRYEHVQDAIESVTDFSDYLEEVKGMSDDRWARDDKVR